MLKDAINVVLGWLKDAAKSENYPELTKLFKECPEFFDPIDPLPSDRRSGKNAVDARS